ncbi:hypothetical protein TNCV_107011 [Trichonephila clavipes]|nr:hypothetical protein TNCV_107011 [Trichonephila clavipes]
MEAQEIHRGKRLNCRPVVSRSLEHHAGDSTIWLLFHPNFERTSWSDQEPLISLPLPPTSREELRFDGYTTCHEGIIPLLTSIPSPRFEHKSYGTTVGVANHYTGWAAGADVQVLISLKDLSRRITRFYILNNIWLPYVASEGISASHYQTNGVV